MILRQRAAEDQQESTDPLTLGCIVRTVVVNDLVV